MTTWECLRVLLYSWLLISGEVAVSNGFTVAAMIGHGLKYTAQAGGAWTAGAGELPEARRTFQLQWCDMELDYLKAAKAMVKYGGGFVAALGSTFFKADQHNKRRIIEAFPDYMAQYDEMARLCEARGEEL